MPRFSKVAAVAASAAAALLAPAAASGGQSAGQGAAVQKVIEMLGGMAVKAKEEKKGEEVAFAKFQVWCSSERSETAKDIQRAGDDAERLDAEMGKQAADIQALGAAVKKLQSSIEANEADLKEERQHREKEHADFVQTEKDFSESVDALERALTTLESQNYDRPAAAAALLQLKSSSDLPEDARAMVDSFLGVASKGEDSEAGSPLGGGDFQAPEADVYEAQSGGVVALLKKLRDDFRDKLGIAQKEEMNAAHAFQMISQDLSASIENSRRDVEDRTKLKEQKSVRKSEAEKQSQFTKSARAADQERLTEVSAECQEKQASFEEKQQLRTEEIEAIEKASEILSSGKVAGAAEKHLSLVQGSTATVLLQGMASRASAERALGIRRRVREFVTSESKRLQSKSLALLADKMSADPFGKVKQMIDAMITRLLEEANEDAEHEGFCDTEMGKSKATRTSLTEDIDALTAGIDEGKAMILEFADSTSELQKELSDLGAAVQEATHIRSEEKIKNKATIEDAQEAQKAVVAATAVLNDFYTKGLQATALVQSDAQPGQSRLSLLSGIKMGSDEWDSLANPNFEGAVDKGHKQGQQTFGEVHRGQQDRAGGVLAMLEVIKSEFANLAADTSAAEVAAVQAYKRFMAEGSKSRATKEKKVEMNDADRVGAEAKLQQDTADLKATQDELLSANRYHEKLVPQCVDQGQTWEERVAARQAETESLKQALKLLSSPDVA